MLTWLRPRVREVDVEHIGLDARARADQLSLFVVIYMGGRSSAGNRPLFGGHYNFETAGFAADWCEALRGRPGRYAKIDAATLDKFVRLTSSESARCLSNVRIRETLAYDLQYRSDIAATATSIAIQLATPAVNPLVEFVEAYGHLDAWPKHQTRLMLRVPAKRLVAFPEPRGADNPYSSGAVDLPRHAIATLHADWLEVGVYSRADASPIEWETQPLIDLVSSPSILRLSV